MTVLINQPVESYNDLRSGIYMLNLLEQLDMAFFTVWNKDMFKNVSDLNEVQFRTASENNWNVIYKAFKSYLEKMRFQDSYIEDINLDLIIGGDGNEIFGFFLILISVILMKKNYVWNQSLGKIQNSDTYNLLKNLESTLSVAESQEDVTKPAPVMGEMERDEHQTLVEMIADLEKKLREEAHKSNLLVKELDMKKEEVDEIRKMNETKTFEIEKMKMRLEALEQTQKEYYDAMAIQKDLILLSDQVKKLEKREEDLEMENSFLRDKINEQDKKIKELKEIESKYQVEENMRKKFEMVLERNESMNTDSRKKDLEIEGLKYQIELLKKNKDAIESALIASKNEKLKLDQELSNFKEEVKSKEQEISNMERIIVKLKDNIEMTNMSSQNTVVSPTMQHRSNL